MTQGRRLSLERKRRLHVLLPLFIGSLLAYLDRVNIAYAALTVNVDLNLTPEGFGMGAGVFCGIFTSRNSWRFDRGALESG